MKITTLATLRPDGTLTLNRNQYQKELRALARPDKDVPIVITTERRSKKRSSPQNRYLHGIVIPLVKEGLFRKGHNLSLSEAKDLIKLKFLKADLVDIDTGEYIEYIKETSTLTTTGMMEFIAAVQQWSAEYLDIYIPEPHEPFQDEK